MQRIVSPPGPPTLADQPRLGRANSPKTAHAMPIRFVTQSGTGRLNQCNDFQTKGCQLPLSALVKFYELTENSYALGKIWVPVTIQEGSAPRNLLHVVAGSEAQSLKLRLVF